MAKWLITLNEDSLPLFNICMAALYPTRAPQKHSFTHFKTEVTAVIDLTREDAIVLALSTPVKVEHASWDFEEW